MRCLEGGNAQGLAIALEAMAQRREGAVGVDPFDQIGKDLRAGLLAMQGYLYHTQYGGH